MCPEFLNGKQTNKKKQLAIYSQTSPALEPSFRVFLLPLLSEVLKLSLLSKAAPSVRSRGCTPCDSRGWRSRNWPTQPEFAGAPGMALVWNLQTWVPGTQRGYFSTKGQLSLVLDRHCSTSLCCVMELLTTGLSQSDWCDRAAGPGPCTDHGVSTPHLTKDAPGLGSTPPFILLGSAMDLRSQRHWPWKLKFGVPNISHMLCQSQPSLADPSPDSLFQACSQPRLLFLKPFYSRRLIAISWHWALTWDLQDDHSMSP